VPAAAAPATDPAMNSKIQVHDLNLWFGDKQVLKQVNAGFPAHSVTALMGPSGCGKSTLLRSINRLNDLVPGTRIEGRIELDGRDIHHPDTDVVGLRRRVGMVFQKPNPFPKSIFDNLAYGLRLEESGGTRRHHDAVEHSLKRAGLWHEVSDRLQDPALDLSGGQQQRLCIARTIAVSPEVILMDEPCSALDPASTRTIEDLMTELKEQFTIIVVTHNMQQARRISDHTAVMYLGELVEFGPTAEVFESPRHEITRSYVQGDFG